MKSYFPTLKTERPGRKQYQTRDDLRIDVFGYIKHSTIRNAATRPSATMVGILQDSRNRILTIKKI
jgi:hypothetical protein